MIALLIKPDRSGRISSHFLIIVAIVSISASSVISRSWYALSFWSTYVWWSCSNWLVCYVTVISFLM